MMLRSKQVRRCKYLIRLLESGAQQLLRSCTAELSPAGASASLVVYGLALAREVLRTSSNPIAQHLLVRALWNTTGHLAWLVSDSSCLNQRFDSLVSDYHARSDEWMRHAKNGLGKDSFEQMSKLAGIDPTSKAEASSQPQDRTWRHVCSKELESALEALLTSVCTSPGNNSGEVTSLTEINQRLALARRDGDHFAHPNLVAIFDLLGLIDPETKSIRTRVPKDARQPKLILTWTEGLLFAQAAAIHSQWPESLDLPSVLDWLGSSTVE